MRSPTREEMQHLRDALYEVNAAGGFGHIVFDDSNMVDGDINFCIREAEKCLESEEYEEHVNAALALVALRAFKRLPMEKRIEWFACECCKEQMMEDLKETHS